MDGRTGYHSHSFHSFISFLGHLPLLVGSGEHKLGPDLVMGMTTISGGIDWLGWHGAGYLKGWMLVAVAVAVG